MSTPGPTTIAPTEPAFVHTRLAETPFHRGRAGLLYRDLIPSRLGGRWIASHIRAAPGGPVEDRVHHHSSPFAADCCLSGEAELVYEEQGPPFTFRAGDLVLQPPGLRHRVLAVSDGFEVVEIASPAWHPTSIDHDMALPSRNERPNAPAPASGSSMPSPTGVRVECWLTGVEARDLGLAWGERRPRHRPGYGSRSREGRAPGRRRFALPLRDRRAGRIEGPTRHDARHP